MARSGGGCLPRSWNEEAGDLAPSLPASGAKVQPGGSRQGGVLLGACLKKAAPPPCLAHTGLVCACGVAPNNSGAEGERLDPGEVKRGILVSPTPLGQSWMLCPRVMVVRSPCAAQPCSRAEPSARGSVPPPAYISCYSAFTCSSYSHSHRS